MGNLLFNSLNITFTHRFNDENLSAGYTTINGKRKSNEDAHCIKKLDNDRYFFGVFDGHNGDKCSKFLSENLYKKFENVVINDKTIIDSCLEIDKIILNDPEIQNNGSTATFSIVQKENEKYHTYISNVGDSLTFIIRDGKILYCTEEHKPNNTIERNRIEKCNGYVADNRLNGQLALSRAFGDLIYKNSNNSNNTHGKKWDINPNDEEFFELFNNGKLDPTNFKLISIPDIEYFECYENDIIVHICDGIIESKMTVEDVKTIINDNVTDELGYITALVGLESLRNGTNDNVSCMIIKLNSNNDKTLPEKEFVIPPFVCNYERTFYNTYQNMLEIIDIDILKALNIRKQIITNTCELSKYQEKILDHICMKPINTDEIIFIKNWEGCLGISTDDLSM